MSNNRRESDCINLCATSAYRVSDLVIIYKWAHILLFAFSVITAIENRVLAWPYEMSITRHGRQSRVVGKRKRKALIFYHFMGVLTRPAI